MNFTLRYVFALSLVFAMFSCHEKEPITPIEPSPINLDVKFKSPTDSLVVDGYFNKFSFNQGEEATLYLNTKIKTNEIAFSIYDINNRLVSYIKCAASPQKVSTDLPYQNGFKYQPTAKVIIPATLKSGMYSIAGKVFFIVKNASTKKGDFLILHPSHNDIAYNNQGGYSYYYPSHANRARVLSFDRPWMFGENGDPRHFYQWVLKMGYNADFICDDEMQEYKNIESYKMLLVAGHSEYWTKAARLNFDKYVDAGNNVLLLSGNSMYWQTRVDAVKRQLICYKYDAYYNDPVTDLTLKTAKWEDYYVNYDELNSIGLNFYTYGGYESSRQGDPKGFKGFRIIQPNFPIFKGLNYAMNDTLVHNPIEYDGGPVTFKASAKGFNYPVFDNTSTKFYKIDILGWDYARPDYGMINNHYNIGLCIIMKKKQTSGMVLNMSSSNWCFDIDKRPALQKVSENAIDFMLKNTDYSVSKIE